jgi:hypothetical protein
MQQPWLNPPGTPPRRGVPDDFSPASATISWRGAMAALAVVWLILLAGRSEAIVDAAYGLPVAPGTETLIAVAEGWNAGLSALGLPQALSALRDILATGR